MTRDSLVQALRSTETDVRDRAFGLVVRVYRAPVIALLVHQWSLQSADAEDLAHDFFASAFEKAWLSRYDGDRGRFRTFLRACLQAFASDWHDSATRLKRGGGIRHEPLSDTVPVASSDDAMDAWFEREWVRSILHIALESLHDDARGSAHEVAVALFKRYDVDGSDMQERPTYAALAAEFGIPATQVTNHLAWARRRFRQHVLDTVRALTGSQQEYRDEVRVLLGIDV